MQNIDLTKIIAIDFDDTIALKTGNPSVGDPVEAWEGTIPNRPLIKNMQKLSEQGYKFVIYTARGTIDYSDINKIKHKYKQKMELWLKKYNVPYVHIQFGKIYAHLYVDDKAMTPEEFTKFKG
jgi:histidinol phosphatase-like enzyme